MGNQRRLYEIINNPEMSAKDIRASIKLDVELIFARLKLEYEGVTFSREF
jgi:hypothetical protein